MFYGTYKLMMDRYPSVSSARKLDTGKLDTDSLDFAGRIRRRRARRVLLAKSDHLLADMGFSRELLEQGVKAWPWLIDAEPTHKAVAGASVIALNVLHSNHTEEQHLVINEQRYAA